MNPVRGMLWEITGGDRVGKNTQSTLLREITNGVLLSFPDYTGIAGSIIQACLRGGRVDVCNGTEEKYWNVTKDSLVPNSMQAFHFVSRMQRQSEIEQAMNAGVDVVCDRYIADAYFYGAEDGASLDFIRDINAYLIQPDLTIILLGAERERLGEIPDANEQPDYQSRVRARYEAVEDGENVAVVHTVIGETVAESILLTHHRICESILSKKGIALPRMESVDEVRCTLESKGKTIDG